MWVEEVVRIGSQRPRTAIAAVWIPSSVWYLFNAISSLLAVSLSPSWKQVQISLMVLQKILCFLTLEKINRVIGVESLQNVRQGEMFTHSSQYCHRFPLRHHSKSEICFCLSRRQKSILVLLLGFYSGKIWDRLFQFRSDFLKDSMYLMFFTSLPLKYLDERSVINQVYFLWSQLALARTQTDSAWS